MRQGILNTLEPFFKTDDAFSGMIAHTLRKILQRATLEQLVDVLNSAKGFVNEMEPYLNEANNVGYSDTDSGISSYGQGIDSGGESVREIDPISADHPAFLEEVQRKVSGSSSGHETPLEGDQDSDGSAAAEAV